MSDRTTLVTDPSAWAALVTLIAMKLVLGIDNLVFVSILTNTLPESMRVNARRIGIGGALVLRLALLGTVAFIVRLTEPVVELLGRGFSWRDLILIAGGLFLVWKATREIHHSVDPNPEPAEPAATAAAAATMTGAMLIADGFGVHVPKGYIYAAMAFAGLVEGLNMLTRRAARRRTAPGAQDRAQTGAGRETSGTRSRGTSSRG